MYSTSAFAQYAYLAYKPLALYTDFLQPLILL